MSKLGSHNSSIGNKYPISINDLIPGMIVEFTYRKDSVGKPQTKRYVVMIVDPSFQRPNDKESMTHAINLDVAPRASLLEVARKTGTTIANSNLQARRIEAEKIVAPGEPRQFYQSTIAGLLTGAGKGSYRTYKTDRIKGIQLIDYKFPEEIEFRDPGELNYDEN